MESRGASFSGFFFFIFKKIKISKIYVGFGKFQKYTPVALWGATGLKCNFFSSNLQRSPWRKKNRGPVAPQGRQGPLMQIGTIASVAFFSYVVLYLSDYYATFDI